MVLYILRIFANIHAGMLPKFRFEVNGPPWMEDNSIHVLSKTDVFG